MSYREKMEAEETDDLLDIYRRLSRDMKRQCQERKPPDMINKTFKRAATIEQILRERGEGGRVEATARAVQNE